MKKCNGLKNDHSILVPVNVELSMAVVKNIIRNGLKMSNLFNLTTCLIRKKHTG